MELLWLGYDNLSVRYADIAAVLFYQAPLDRLITRAYGCVPSNIRAVVITSGGEHWPSSRHAEQLHRHWVRWRTTVKK